MSKLSRNGYIIKKKDFNLKEIKEIKDELNVKPFNFNDIGTGTEKKFQVYLESPNKLYLPRFYGINRFGEPNENKIGDGEKIKINFKGDLREEQKPIFDIVNKELLEKGGAIISLKCGGGKTVLSLYILAQLKVKSMVVVHKDFLMTQWKDRIEEFIPNAKIGKIQQNTIDIDGKDIVLAMVQSLSMKEYDKDIFKSFGLIIFDECHHLGAEMFSKCMPKVASKYMLGLSATPNRKDGLRKVFEWYIGEIAYTSKEKNEDYVEVSIINFDSIDETYCKVENGYQGKPNFPKMINKICEFKPRTEIIISKTIELFNEGDRNILILSDRRGHLDYISIELSKFNISCGFYVGGVKPELLREAQNKDIVLGTFSMASEGMDIPKLNTIILSSPKSDIVQSVGRILRQKKENRIKHPHIIDINDGISMFNNQYKKRLSHYSKNKYDITIFNIDGTKEKYKTKNTKNKKKINLEECLID